MICKRCGEKFRTTDTPDNRNRVCYHCGFNHGKKQDDNQQMNKGESVNKTADINIKDKLSPEFDDLIKTLQFPDKFYNTLDRVIAREIKEYKDKVNKIIEEWYLKHRKKGDGIGELYEELKLKLEEIK